MWCVRLFRNRKTNKTMIQKSDTIMNVCLLDKHITLLMHICPYSSNQKR